MIRLSSLPDDDVEPEKTAAMQDPDNPPQVGGRKPRGVPVSSASAATDDLRYLNPAQVAGMWGVSHDKVLEFIKTGELHAFNVASKKSRRPQFKIPLAAVRKFEERRSGRDPARSLPPVPRRRASQKPSASSTREYF